MNKLVSGKNVFEIVESIPENYKLWNIGKNMKEGYLPLIQTVGNTYSVNIDTMKAIKVDEAQTILLALGRGQNTVKDMERYIKRYSNSKNICTQRHVNRLIESVKILKTVKGFENLVK